MATGIYGPLLLKVWPSLSAEWDSSTLKEAFFVQIFYTCQFLHLMLS